MLVDLLWEVCLFASQSGYELLGMNEITTTGAVSRDVCADTAPVVVAFRLWTHGVWIQDLDEAYHTALFNSTPQL